MGTFTDPSAVTALAALAAALVAGAATAFVATGAAAVVARRQPARRQGRGDEGHHADHHPGADPHAAFTGFQTVTVKPPSAVRRPAGLRDPLGRQHRVGDHHEHVVHARPLPGEAEVPGRAGHARASSTSRCSCCRSCSRARIPGSGMAAVGPATRRSRPRSLARRRRDAETAPLARRRRRPLELGRPRSQLRPAGGRGRSRPAVRSSDVEVLGLERGPRRSASPPGRPPAGRSRRRAGGDQLGQAEPGRPRLHDAPPRERVDLVARCPSPSTAPSRAEWSGDELVEAGPAADVGQAVEGRDAVGQAGPDLALEEGGALVVRSRSRAGRPAASSRPGSARRPRGGSRRRCVSTIIPWAERSTSCEATTQSWRGTARHGTGTPIRSATSDRPGAGGVDQPLAGDRARAGPSGAAPSSTSAAAPGVARRAPRRRVTRPPSRRTPVTTVRSTNRTPAARARPAVVLAHGVRAHQAVARREGGAREVVDLVDDTASRRASPRPASSSTSRPKPFCIPTWARPPRRTAPDRGATGSRAGEAELLRALGEQVDRRRAQLHVDRLPPGGADAARVELGRRAHAGEVGVDHHHTVVTHVGQVHRDGAPGEPRTDDQRPRGLHRTILPGRGGRGEAGGEGAGSGGDPAPKKREAGRGGEGWKLR